MTGPTVLFGVGATKAGTSWLYRYLHDHPECAMPAVKEAHYWDTFAAQPRARQLDAYRRRLAELEALLSEATAAKRDWQVRNVTRRIADMTALIEVLEGDRRTDDAYIHWLTDRARMAKLTADITPNYGTLPEERLTQMLSASATSKVIYLMRDPIARLWSHVRMQASRARAAGEDLAETANNLLWRVVHQGSEAHVLARGDYRSTVSRLRATVPGGRLMVLFMERMLTSAGLRQMCDFLGLTYHAAEHGAVHVGEEVPMRADLRPKVAAFLQDQYDWVAAHVGPLPNEWRDNLQRAYA